MLLTKPKVRLIAVDILQGNLFYGSLGAGLTRIRPCRRGDAGAKIAAHRPGVKQSRMARLGKVALRVGRLGVRRHTRVSARVDQPSAATSEHLEPATKSMRAPNAIDFWRGLALVMIFINHVPGNVFVSFTLRNYAISDAAEIFVFLAGWSLSHATGGPESREPASRTVFRLFSRALLIYTAQLAITLIALAILSATSIIRDDPLYLEWLNAGSAFYDPVHAFIGLTLMTYQLGFFNILPLYVVLLLIAPPFLIVARWQKRWAAALSLLVYVAVLASGLSLPSWPAEDQWYFNPLAWQVLLVLGYVAAELTRESEVFRARVRLAVPLAAAVSVVGAAVAMSHVHPDPLAVPSPRLFILFDKTFLSPARLINLLALVIAFSGVFPLLKHLPTLVAMMCALGRNSLPVFCVASLLSLVGQIIRFANQGSWLIDAAIVLSGLALLELTAWFVEWRQRENVLALSRR
jgi:hypothetical protein